MDECSRIADQLHRAFDGQAWHGQSIGELLAGVPEQAQAHPLPDAHSVWELVLHIEVWAHAAFDATQGTPMPKIVGTEKDWQPVPSISAENWNAALKKLYQTKDQLA